MKLEPDNQIALTKETLDVVLSAFSITDFTFEPINEGIANSSARIESANKKYVLRIYAQGKKDEDILFEIGFQDYLRNHNIPIPVIHKNRNGEELTIAVVNGKRWQAILMDFVEGKSVTVQPSHELIAELANLQAKMHLLGIEFEKSVDRPKKLWADLHDGLVSKVENTTVGGQEVRDLLERIKAYSYPLSPDLPYGYNHLDIDFDGNVLTKDNRVSGIVDFEDVQYSPVIVCLGYSLWNILDDEGIEAMNYYLKEYEKVRSLTPVEYEALSNVVFFRNYVMVVIRLLLWDENTPLEDITSLIRLEKDIPILLHRTAHQMKLQPSPFEKIKNGSKTIEIRLNDEKRRLLKTGDQIEFVLMTDPKQTIKTEVLWLEKFESFKDLFAAYPLNQYGGESQDEWGSMHKYYSPEDEAKYGVVAIKVGVVQSAEKPGKKP